MSDDRTKAGGRDRQTINLSENYEVRDWADKFGVTEDPLREAVTKVGNNAKVVEDALASRH